MYSQSKAHATVSGMLGQTSISQRPLSLCVAPIPQRLFSHDLPVYDRFCQGLGFVFDLKLLQIQFQFISLKFEQAFCIAIHPVRSLITSLQESERSIVFTPPEYPHSGSESAS